MNLSKRQFERRLKLLTGFSPAKFIQEFRLVKAMDFLVAGNFESVSEVSFECGFSSPSYFTKVFTLRFGKKPSAYKA